MCTRICTSPPCCRIHMINAKNFNEECLSPLSCELVANHDDILCACPDKSIGGSSQMRQDFRRWRNSQFTTTTAATTTSTGTAVSPSTTSDIPAPAPATAAPEAKPLQTRSVAAFVTGVVIALACAGVGLGILLVSAYRRVRARNISELLPNREINEEESL